LPLPTDETPKASAANKGRAAQNVAAKSNAP